MRLKWSKPGGEQHKVRVGQVGAPCKVSRRMLASLLKQDWKPLEGFEQRSDPKSDSF